MVASDAASSPLAGTCPARNAAGGGPTRPTYEDPNHPEEGPITTILVLLAFLLVVDALVLLGYSHDSRDGWNWQPGR
jgi:hypothetical protein